MIKAALGRSEAMRPHHDQEKEPSSRNAEPEARTHFCVKGQCLGPDIPADNWCKLVLTLASPQKQYKKALKSSFKCRSLLSLPLPILAIYFNKCIFFHLIVCLCGIPSSPVPKISPSYRKPCTTSFSQAHLKTQPFHCHQWLSLNR